MKGWTKVCPLCLSYNSSRCHVGFLNKADKKGTFLSDDLAPVESKSALAWQACLIVLVKIVVQIITRGGPDFKLRIDAVPTDTTSLAQTNLPGKILRGCHVRQTLASRIRRGSGIKKSPCTTALTDTVNSR